MMLIESLIGRFFMKCRECGKGAATNETWGLCKKCFKFAKSICDYPVKVKIINK